MEPLATVEDMEALGVPVEDEERPIVERYLDVASAGVRDAAGVPITEATTTVMVEGSMDRRLRLPGPPVSTVEEIVLDGDQVEDHRVLPDGVWRREGWSSPTGVPTMVEVTYTHGLPRVPADIVALVCRIAATTLMAHRSDETGGGIGVRRVTQLRIGDYSASFADDGTMTEVELPETTRSRLRARFGGGAAVVRST